MNVIYSLSTMSEWIQVAQNMKERENWNPILWLSTIALETQISECFPQCKIEEYMSANRGEFKHFNMANSFNPLDEEKIVLHVKTEKTVLKMMDRMDPTQRNFSYVERSALYYKILTYWQYIFDTHQVDCILFNETPHFPLDYVLYAVAKERGVKVLRFSPTHMKSRVLLAGDIESTPAYLEEAGINQVPSEEISEYLERLAGDYSKAVPFYMKNISDTSFSFKKLFTFFKQGWRYLYAAPASPLRGKNGFVSNKKLPGLYLGYYRLLGNLYKKRLEYKYSTVMVDVDLNQNYIYVPLHYQPEKTTCPEGGVFVDQYLMIAMISKVLPEGWKIYVKEHVSQFSTKLYGERGRSPIFYEQILSLGNVELVSLSYQSFDLIDNAKAVATVTGTSALEAINRECFAFIFGSVWFQSCEGIITIVKKDDMLQALKRVERGEKPSKEKIKSFFGLIDRHSTKAYTALGGNKEVSGVSSEENIKNLTELLQNYSEKLV